MNLSISPEDIDALMKETLLKSGFGKAITEGIAKVLNGYDNPIQQKLKEHIGFVCAELIRDKFEAEIREAVARHIESSVTKEIVDTAAAEAVKKMVHATRNY